VDKVVSVSADRHLPGRVHELSVCKLILSICGRHRRYLEFSCRQMKVIMSLTADASDGKTGCQSSADACGRGWYLWRKRKCLRLHISSAVAGINCDGRHHESVSLLSCFLLACIMSAITRLLCTSVTCTVVVTALTKSVNHFPFALRLWGVDDT